MKLTTASKITIVRMLLIPVVLVLMYLDFEGHMYFALAAFVIASLSDFADGYIARHYNQVTNFGKFLDPLAVPYKQPPYSCNRGATYLYWT